MLIHCGRALDAGVSLGLGSDVAGGYSLSLETNMRSAVYTARMREGLRLEEVHKCPAELEDAGGHPGTISKGDGLGVTWTQSLFLATKGGKQALGMGGCFEVGMEFDAQKSEWGPRARRRSLPFSGLFNQTANSLALINFSSAISLTLPC